MLRERGCRTDRGTGGAGATGGLAITVFRVTTTTFFLAIGTVRFDVFAEVVAPHEALVTHGASEPLLTCVGAQMPLKLVRSCEPLATEQPVTDEGTFACVPPEMSLQVRGFVVDLAATRDVTAVNVSLAEVGAGGPQTVGFVTVRAVTRGPPSVAALRPWTRHSSRRRQPRPVVQERVCTKLVLGR